jgi:TonB family protein
MAVKFHKGLKPAPAGAPPRHGAVEPPEPLNELDAESANLYVLSVDDELVETVRRAVSEHSRVFFVSDWLELEAAIQTGRCGVALLDADLLGTSLERHIDELDGHPARTVVLVAAQRPDAEGLMGLLSERKLHRLLIKPPAPGITRLLVESAIKRSRQVRDLPPTDSAVDEPPAPAVRASAGVPAWIYTAAAAALLLGTGVVIGISSLWRAPPAPDAPTARVEAEAASTAPPVEYAPSANARVADLLSRAEQASREGRLAAPPGDNALEHYLALLAVDPSEPVAREKLSAVVDALFGQAEAALLAGANDAAAEALGNIRRAEPTSKRLLFLEAQLERARAAARAQTVPNRAAPAPPPVVAVAAAPVQAEPPVDAGSARSATAAERATLRHAEWLASARQRLVEGALVAPAADSAYYYLTALQAEAPDFPGLDAAWRDWTGALSSEAQTELAARRLDSAAALLGTLQSAPSGARVAAPLLDELRFAQQQERYLATPVAASEFSLLERVTPAYPELAARRGQEGWVDVEFTIDSTGRVADAVVSASEPAGRFDAAAVAAVSQYRYEPFELEGRRYARRARLRVRFTLQ